MKQLCSLVSIATKDGPKVLAISPTDKVWFVSVSDSPPEYNEFLKDCLAGDDMDCLGHVFVDDELLHNEPPKEG